MVYPGDNYYIEKVLNGDTSAYAYMVNRHKDMVFTIANRILKNREDAEEVAGCQDSKSKVKQDS